MSHINRKTLIYREDAVRAIRDHMNATREAADRAYIARIREEDIKLIEQVPAAYEKVIEVPTSEREGY